MSDRRPTDVRGVLVTAAEFLDLADKAFQRLAELKGIKYEPSQENEIQTDLRKLAQWFASYPETDRKVYAETFGGE